MLPQFSSFTTAQIGSVTVAARDQLLIELLAEASVLDGFTRPGQFCRVRVRDARGEHEGIFALATAPFERAIRFLVRTGNLEGGEAADALALAGPGDEVGLTLPSGDGFALELAKGLDVHFVATGTAIAPVRSAIETVLRMRHEFGSLTLDYGTRSPLHVAFGPDLERWKSLGIPTEFHYSAPNDDGEVRGVRVQDRVLARVSDLSKSAFVAVGQSAMVAELRDHVRRAGGDPARVLHNY
jgi:NAD(P)H-flavin reductase